MKNNVVETGKELVGLIKYVCFGGEYPTITDYKALIAMANRHNLMNVFYYGVLGDANCPEEVLKVATKRYYASVNQQELQSYYQDAIFKKFLEKGVKFMKIKGDEVRRFYPNKLLRTSCDVDFVYDSNYEATLIEVLKELGFDDGVKSSHHYHFRNPPVAVEAHFNVDSDLDTEKGRKADLHFENYFETHTPISGSQYVLSDSDFYLHYTMHAVKHFRIGGFGIRTILDFCYINEGLKDNLTEVRKFAVSYGLEKFLTLIDRLIDYWFNGGEADEDLLNFEEFIIKSGTYGSSVNNASYASINDGDGKNVKGKYLFSRIFPPFNNIASMYSWVKKVPILLPVGYVVRWFEVLFTRPKNIKTVFDTAKKIKSTDVDLTEKVYRLADLE